MALSEKDLRIGNLVKWYDVSKILELHSEKNKFDNVYIECEESFEWTEYNKLEPIPLTEEWLLKFGFLIIEINGKGTKQIEQQFSPFFEKVEQRLQCALVRFWEKIVKKQARQ